MGGGLKEHLTASPLRGLEGRKVPAACWLPSTGQPLLSSLLIRAPGGPLSKHRGNDLRPRQLLVSSLLTKALKPKTLKKRKKEGRNGNTSCPTFANVTSLCSSCFSIRHGARYRPVSRIMEKKQFYSPPCGTFSKKTKNC